MLRMLRALLRPDSYRRGAGLQERADVLRLYLLTQARASWPAVEARTLDDIEAHAPTVADQRSIVLDEAQECVLRMLGAWQVEQPPPLPPHARRRASGAAPDSEEAKARQAAEVKAWEAERDAAQLRAFGFRIRRAPSTAGDGAGDGVHLEGRAIPGDVVALYPGVSLTPADIARLPGGSRRCATWTKLLK